MAGRNVFEDIVQDITTGKSWTESRLKERSQEKSSCVFISHRKSDTDAAKAIALYLKYQGVDIYFDEYDRLLSAAVAAGETKLVVQYIQMGISFSTHLLGVISPDTKGSWWVPFEIGLAWQRDKELSVAYLLLDNVDHLPEYLQITKNIKDRYELRNWVKKEFDREILLERKSAEQLNLPNIPRLPLARHASPTFVKVI